MDSNKEMFISGCFGCRLNVWSFPSCERIHSIKTCHPINCVSIEQHPRTAAGFSNSGNKTVLAATCSRTGKINSFSPNVVLWNVVTGECVKKFDLPSACFVQVRFQLPVEHLSEDLLNLIKNILRCDNILYILID